MAARSQKRTTKRKKTRLLLYGFNQDFNHNTGEYCVDNFLKGVNGVCMTMMNCGRSMIQEQSITNSKILILKQKGEKHQFILRIANYSFKLSGQDKGLIDHRAGCQRKAVLSAFILQGVMCAGQLTPTVYWNASNPGQFNLV